MPARDTDTGVLSPGWAGTGANALLDDRAWVQAMLDTEVALAAAQAQLGVIPPAAAELIARVADARDFDLPALADGVHATANPVVGLVSQLTALVAAHSSELAEYVHRGSTSQDILDSAAMLVCARTLTRIRQDLSRCADALAGLVAEHRETVMAGRTLTLHAVPTTFGLKAATWLQLVLDVLDRLQPILDTGLPASLGGAAGTLSAYQEYATLAGVADADGIDLIAPFAARLGLAEPLVPWHSVRTPMADVAGVLCVLAGALGKFAIDVQVLNRTEIAEVAEPSGPGRGASSAMPQKRNPVLATAIVTAARQLPPTALIVLQSMMAEDERSAGAWHAEWQPLRECLRLAVGAATNAAELAEGLVVFPDRMRANVSITGGAVVSERLNAILAPALGKVVAKRLLADATAEAASSGKDLADILVRRLGDAAQRQDGQHDAGQHDAGPRYDGQRYDERTIRDLLDPGQYVGAATGLADRVLARHRSRSGV